MLNDVDNPFSSLLFVAFFWLRMYDFGRPWSRPAVPLIDAGPAGEWDDLFTCNPTPHVFPNGSVLLLYKARSSKDPTVMNTGVAFAAHYSGVFKRHSPRPIDVSGHCEDAGIYVRPPAPAFTCELRLRVERLLAHCIVPHARDPLSLSLFRRPRLCLFIPGFLHHRPCVRPSGRRRSRSSG